MSTVLDASILADILLFTPRGQRAAASIHPTASDFHLPHLADIETASILRNLARGGLVAPDRAATALIDLRDFPAKRWPATSFFERLWELRENATTYDACYLALAEELDAKFVTADAKLARGVAHIARCPIVLID